MGFQFQRPSWVSIGVLTLISITTIFYLAALAAPEWNVYDFAIEERFIRYSASVHSGLWRSCSESGGNKVCADIDQSQLRDCAAGKNGVSSSDRGICQKTQATQAFMILAFLTSVLALALTIAASCFMKYRFTIPAAITAVIAGVFGLIAMAIGASIVRDRSGRAGASIGLAAVGWLFAFAAAGALYMGTKRQLDTDPIHNSGTGVSSNRPAVTV